MKKTTIFAAILAAALLTGCGEDKPLDNTSSSSSSTASSSSSSSSSIASSSSSSSTSSSTASSSSVAESSTSSSSTPTTDPDTNTEPTQSSSTPTSTTPEPTQSSSTPTSTTTSTSSTTNPEPIQSSTSSTSFSSQPTTDPVTKYWNPDAPGNTPGPYGGYYDASGNLHCKKANMPYDKGYPIISYEDERGTGHLTYAEKLKAQEEEERIWAGGLVTDIGLTWDDIP